MVLFLPLPINKSKSLTLTIYSIGTLSYQILIRLLGNVFYTRVIFSQNKCGKLAQPQKMQLYKLSLPTGLGFLVKV